MNTEPQNPGSTPPAGDRHGGTGGHDVPLTPPPASPTAPTPPAAYEDERTTTAPRSDAAPVETASAHGPSAPGSDYRSARTAIVVVTAVVGGVALLASGGTAAVAAVADLSRGDYSQTASAEGVDALDVEVGGSDVTVVFDDVDDAELEVIGGRRGTWTIERRDDELVVRSPDRLFGWFGWSGGWFGDDERVVLTLPEELNTGELDAAFDLGAGSLDVDGDFAALSADVGAGALFISGSADTLDADINAGRAEIRLDGVREADFRIAAGRLTGELTGLTPDAVTVDVTAGSLEVILPQDTYRVTQEVSAGSFDNGLDESSSSDHVVDVTVAAGSARLTPAD